MPNAPAVSTTEAGERTDRDAAELHRLRAAIEASGEIIFTTDRQGTFTYVNPAFVRAYGYESAEVVGCATPRIRSSSY